MQVAFNESDGSFIESDGYGVAAGPWDPVAADFNGDAAMDSAVGCYTGDNVSVIYNIPSSSTDVAEPTPPGLTLEPNPFRQSIAIALRGVRTQSENVDIIDVNGRLVQRLVLRRSASGIVAGAWDGADERGRKVAPGVYFCRPAFHGLVARILLVR